MANSTLEWCWTGRVSESVTVWSPVSPTSHRVDTHTRARAHARLECETHIADTIVSKSRVLGQIHFV